MACIVLCSSAGKLIEEKDQVLPRYVSSLTGGSDLLKQWMMKLTFSLQLVSSYDIIDYPVGESTCIYHFQYEFSVIFLI
jgi:hypothetical protein